MTSLARDTGEVRGWTRSGGHVHVRPGDSDHEGGPRMANEVPCPSQPVESVSDLADQLR